MKWYEEKPKRLKIEIALIKKFYPKARIFKRKGHLVAFFKVLGRKAHYVVEVVYPDDFPYEEPRAYIVEPKTKDAPHKWGDDHLSLHGNEEPPRLSGKIILDWSTKWVTAYENWLDTGRWPKKIK